MPKRESVNCGLAKRPRAQPSRSAHGATSNSNPTWRDLTKPVSTRFQEHKCKPSEARARSAGCKKSSQSRPSGQDLTSACIN
jgi:hypothetical protein